MNKRESQHSPTASPKKKSRVEEPSPLVFQYTLADVLELAAEVDLDEMLELTEEDFLKDTISPENWYRLFVPIPMFDDILKPTVVPKPKDIEPSVFRSELLNLVEQISKQTNLEDELADFYNEDIPEVPENDPFLIVDSVATDAKKKKKEEELRAKAEGRPVRDITGLEEFEIIYGEPEPPPITGIATSNLNDYVLPTPPALRAAIVHANSFGNSPQRRVSKLHIGNPVGMQYLGSPLGTNSPPKSQPIKSPMKLNDTLVRLQQALKNPESQEGGLNLIALKETLDRSIAKADAKAEQSKLQKMSSLKVKSGLPGKSLLPSIAQPPTAVRQSVKRPPTSDAASRQSVKRPPTANRQTVTRPPTGSRQSVQRPPPQAGPPKTRPGQGSISKPNVVGGIKPTAATGAIPKRPGASIAVPIKAKVAAPTAVVRKTVVPAGPSKPLNAPIKKTGVPSRVSVPLPKANVPAGNKSKVSLTQAPVAKPVVCVPKPVVCAPKPKGRAGPGPGAGAKAPVKPGTKGVAPSRKK